MGLTSIWFAGGALAALIAALCHVPILGQAIIFFVVSFAMLIFTKPFAMKYVKPHNVKTNYEEVIGKEVQITEQIDNRQGTGVAVYNGLEWSARSTDDAVVFEKGETAIVKEVRGVKLYVSK